MNTEITLKEDPIEKLRYLLGNFKSKGLKVKTYSLYVKNNLIEKNNSYLNN